jgi:deoxyribodipyrimidine photo-lyase
MSIPLLPASWADALPPTRSAALARVGGVRPAAYAKTRNHLEGAVTGLSPYLTHGLLTLPEVLAELLKRESLTVEHKLVFELGWREFFRHVWAHAGEDIVASIHPGPLPDAAYAPELPPDIRQACTGVPVIDEAVRTLYATGTLHNHARMWLASYVVHVRRIHWRAGADWLVAHLLDGDLASNHLSWQWVAGTGSHKPYLFNAENVARYAPASWHSPGSVVDCSYEELDRLARAPKLPELPRQAIAADAVPTAEPALHSAPPAPLGVGDAPAPQTLQGRAARTRGQRAFRCGVHRHLPQGTPPPLALARGALALGRRGHGRCGACALARRRPGPDPRPGRCRTRAQRRRPAPVTLARADCTAR